MIIETRKKPLLFAGADRYLAECDWRDLALLKFCLAAMGLLLGLLAPQEKKKPFLLGAALVFAATYLPLMAKYVGVLRKMKTGEG